MNGAMCVAKGIRQFISWFSPLEMAIIERSVFVFYRKSFLYTLQYSPCDVIIFSQTLIYIDSIMTFLRQINLFNKI